MAVSWGKLSGIQDSTSKSQCVLEQLLEEVSFQRRKERRKYLEDGIINLRVVYFYA